MSDSEDTSKFVLSMGEQAGDIHSAAGLPALRGGVDVKRSVAFAGSIGNLYVHS